VQSAIESKLLELVTARAPQTVCPSEVARALDPDDWRPLMDPVREAAARLAEQRRIMVMQGGERVDIRAARGPVRLSLAYRIGRGEEGVLTFEPYKSELLPLWKFATPVLARKSSRALWRKFVEYGRAGDFPGMDMARKFLQMGMTRATRYARHRSGRKYDEKTGAELPLAEDPVKAESAAIFRAAWERAKKNRTYLRLKRAWQEQG
jgi:hypothetical protein